MGDSPYFLETFFSQKRIIKNQMFQKPLTKYPYFKVQGNHDIKEVVIENDAKITISQNRESFKIQDTWYKFIFPNWPYINTPKTNEYGHKNIYYNKYTQNRNKCAIVKIRKWNFYGGYF